MNFVPLLPGELHKKEDFLKIRKWLSGSRRYFLQAYQESEQVIRPIYSSYSKEQLENFRRTASGRD